ncbi:ParA family protein [Agrobacterium rubi]|nr:ParA family protein [Agrobacterium rubi]NTF24518.1 ParA family protein [Agrobacterium rubi]
MMKTVAILGRKGGSGKSTLSYFLAHGMSEGVSDMIGRKIRTTLLRTDNRTRRPSEFSDKRKYMVGSVPGDESDTAYIQDTIEMAASIPDSFLIIDGGANRRNFDYAACAVADLILIPTGCSEEDLETADADFDNLTDFIEKNDSDAEVYLIRNKWPGVQRKYDSLMNKPWVRKYVRKWEKAGVLFPHIIPDMPSFLDLANADEPQATLLLNKLSTGFAQVIAAKVELPAIMEWRAQAEEFKTAAE